MIIIWRIYGLHWHNYSSATHDKESNSALIRHIESPYGCRDPIRCRRSIRLRSLREIEFAYADYVGRTISRSEDLHIHERRESPQNANRTSHRDSG